MSAHARGQVTPHTNAVPLSAQRAGVTVDEMRRRADLGEDWCSKNAHWVPMEDMSSSRGHVCNRCMRKGRG